jgi:acyl dehydratase
MADMAKDEAFYLEDFQPGQRFTSAAVTIDVEQIKAFARQFDPQPFHLDEAAASRSMLKGLSASGWHTAALTMKLITTLSPFSAGGIIGAGAQIDWLAPVRPGDSLHIVCEVTEIRPSRSRPDRGMVLMSVETKNQRGEVVQLLKPKVVVFRRGAAQD